MFKVRTCGYTRLQGFDTINAHSYNTAQKDDLFAESLMNPDIADGTIVAAGSVITHDTEPYSIYAGVPARKIRDRFDNEEDLLKHKEIINNKYGKI